MSVGRRLVVYLGEREVGALVRAEQAEDGFSFAYTDAWLTDPDAFGISLSLPRVRDLDPRRARRFFANLLPEANVRALVCRRLGISDGNDFALLEAIGGECAGALTILPEGAPPSQGAAEYEPLPSETLLELSRGYEALPAVDGRGRVRLSLAGAQDKLPVLEKGGRFFLPLGSSPSSHIIKFPNRSFKHLPANETLLSELGRRVGLPVAKARWQPLGAEGLCVVERYDRIRAEDGTIRRLHQEDLCQALGVASISKYEQEGGPSFAGCVDVVREHSLEPLSDTRALFRWAAFNVIAGNADGHAKNLSLLHDDGWRLAPFYDLVCTRAYDRIDRRLAMKLGEETDPDRIRRPQITACAREVGLRPAWLVDAFRSVAEAILASLPDALEASETSRSPAAERIVPLVRKQAHRILRDLAAA